MTQSTVQDTMEITYAQYAQVMKVGHDVQLGSLLKQRTDEQLKRLLDYVVLADPRKTPFTMMETDGYPMPDSVQRLYGWRYLKALNAFKAAVDLELASRAMDVMTPMATPTAE